MTWWQILLIIIGSTTFILAASAIGIFIVFFLSCIDLD